MTSYDHKISFDLLIQAIFAFEVLSIWVLKITLDKDALKECEMVNEAPVKLSKKSSGYKSTWTLEINKDHFFQKIFQYFLIFIKLIFLLISKWYIFISSYTFPIFLLFFLFYSQKIYNMYNENYETLIFCLILYILIRTAFHILISNIAIPYFTSVIRVTPKIPNLEEKDWQIKR